MKYAKLINDFPDKDTFEEGGHWYLYQVHPVIHYRDPRGGFMETSFIISASIPQIDGHGWRSFHLPASSSGTPVSWIPVFSTTTSRDHRRVLIQNGYNILKNKE